MESISRTGENQFGVKVPTETSAIFNLSQKKAGCQVTRYGMPTLENRERAGIAYNDAIRNGMSSEEALEYAAMEGGVEEEFRDMIPEWGKACKFKGQKRKYTEETKREAVAFFKKRIREVSSQTAYEEMCEKFGLGNFSRCMIYHWEKQLKKKDEKTAELKHDAEIARNKQKAEEPKRFTVAPVKEQVKKDFADTSRKCVHCGKEIPSFVGFAFCPFCGKPIETEKEYALRMGESLKAVLVQRGFSADMVAIVDTMLNVIQKGE